MNVWLHYSWPDGRSRYSWSGGFGKFPPDDNFNGSSSASVCEIKVLHLNKSLSGGLSSRWRISNYSPDWTPTHSLDGVLGFSVEKGSWHEAAECNVIRKRDAKGSRMNLVAWCHHYETLAWYHNDEVIARAGCEFMGLARAQFSVSPLRRDTNENGWRASSGLCVRLSEGTHVRAAVSWWLWAEQWGSGDLQVPEWELWGPSPWGPQVSHVSDSGFHWPMPSVRRSVMSESRSRRPLIRWVSVSWTHLFLPCECVWVGVHVCWWSLRQRSTSWDNRDVQQKLAKCSLSEKYL